MYTKKFHSINDSSVTYKELGGDCLWRLQKYMVIVKIITTLKTRTITAMMIPATADVDSDELPLVAVGGEFSEFK